MKEYPMKHFAVFVGLTLLSSNALALKYMCQKAVRGNSGKFNSVNSQFESAQSNGTLGQKRAGLISTLDTALNAIKSAGCPMNDPEVTKITSPIQQLKAKISGAKATATAAPAPQTASPAVTNTPTPTAASPVASNNSGAPAKLSYPCRQILKRQSGKPKEFERTLGPLRDAVKNGKTVGYIQPGLMLDTKVEAALNDLQAGKCPLNHPDFKTVLDQLKSQQKEIPEIYAELKKRLDNFAKKADVNNYPDYAKDVEIFEIIRQRYSHADRTFKTNMELSWIDDNANKNITFRRNIKSPVYQYDQLKNLLENMQSDGNSYNSQMKLVESKYKELLSANRPLAEKYVRMRDNAAKILGGFYEKELVQLKKILETSIQHNQKVLDLWIKESMEKRSPEFFRGDTLKNILRDTNQAITLFALTGSAEKPKAASYNDKMKKINTRLKEVQKALAEVMLKEQRLGKERYNGGDKEKLRAKIVEKFKEYYPNKELIKVHMSNEDWKVTNYVSWSSGNAYRHHYSELGFYAVVKESSKVAILVGGWYHVNHQQRDKITVSFTFHKPGEMYQNRKILIKNI